MIEMQNARRAQVLSGELITACFIFSLVLVYVFFLWDTTTKNILRSEILYEMDKLGTGAVEKLIRTPGYPEDWTNKLLDNISSMGLANESRMLDRGKILRFINLMDASEYDDLCNDALISNYQCSKHLLGMEKYEFYLTMTDMDDNILNLEGWNCSTGNSPVDEDYLISIPRSAILDDEIVKISFVVWT